MNAEIFHLDDMNVEIISFLRNHIENLLCKNNENILNFMKYETMSANMQPLYHFRTRMIYDDIFSYNAFSVFYLNIRREFF